MFKENPIDIHRQLLVQTQQMDTLLEMMQSLNQQITKQSANQLIRIFEFSLRAYLGVKKVCVLFKEQDTWRCAICYGYDASIEDIQYYIQLCGEDVLSLQTHLQAEEVISIPAHNEVKSLVFVVQEEQDQQLRASNLTFVKTLFNVLLSKLELKQLIDQQIVQEAVNRELKMAGAIQRNILPKELPSTDEFMMVAYNQPHFQVGGDFYDVIKVSKDEYYLIIADVSGKGVSAAIMMANLQSSLRSFISSQTSLTAIVNKLNGIIAELSSHEKFLTLFIAKVNLSKKEIYYINCGHTPPILKKGSDIKVLEKGTTILGMFDDIKIQSGREKITAQTHLILYTDGITEATNPNHDFYELERLIQVVEELPAKATTKEIQNAVLQSVTLFQQGTKANDDLTLVVCTFKG